MSGTLSLWLCGEFAGHLTEAQDGSVSFRYADSYRDRSAADALPAVSASLPLTRSAHPASLVDPWLDNLLPDDDEVRRLWAARFGERHPSAFALLRRMGADCPGAVQVLAEGAAPTDAAKLQPLTESGIAAHIAELRRNPAQWLLPDRGGRWSLGGQQSKFALALIGGEWFAPSGRAASTHIVKTGIAGLELSDVAEFVTLSAARALGLPVAGANLTHFGDQVTLVVSRFDRVVGAEGTVTRLHQEDFCQASGRWRAQKYQVDGGPSLADCAALIERVTDRRDRERSLRDFARALCFNWACAGTDAHAKNFAFVYAGRRAALAPFFDLLSATLIWPPSEVEFKAKLAMKVAGRYRLRRIGLPQLRAAAPDLRVDADFVQATAVDYAQAVPDAVADAVRSAQEAGAVSTARAAAFIDNAAARSRSLRL
ncbi:MAG: HipA domain-containing protein [Bifidobacteriaceae bacterium]|jgi:serine/threonine-protein kinase HipA|nr:HipA domain-containing protein [Bifidobacteriaceae bacterium]